MNFCFVYKEDYPWDVRVEKVINTLFDLGYSVDLVCKNTAQKPTREQAGKLAIHRLPNTAWLPKPFQSAFNVALWFNPFWLYLIYKTAKASSSTAIIVRDLPLMMSAILIAKLLKIKVIFDMAECYPEMYRSAAQHDKVSFLNKILKSPLIAAAYEKFSVRHCDHVFVMIEESKLRLINMGFSEEKITIVSNTPVVNQLDIKARTHIGDELRIIYVGFVTKLRGIDLLIKAIRKFIDDPAGGAKIRFDIIGKGSAKDSLIELVEDLNLNNHVFVHGWLDHDEAKNLMNQANVGSLTYRVCSHWNNTIPNKIFDYMANGLPVLATNVIPIQRILLKEECGLVSSDADIKKISSNLIALKNSKYRNKLGANGQAAVISRFNWAIDQANLNRALTTILRQSN